MNYHTDNLLPPLIDPSAFRLGINLCWADENKYHLVLNRYSEWMGMLQKVGINFLRIWCPPWVTQDDQAPNRKTIVAWQTWQRNYFKAILDIAKSYNMDVLICLYSHVELVDRNWQQEVLNKQFTWHGNPYNAKNGGPCIKSWEFFTNNEAMAHQIEHLEECYKQFGTHDALVGWELFNEADQVDGFSEKAFTNWCVSLAHILRKIRKNIPITVSLADGFKGKKLWNSPEIDLVQCHCHGWPYHDPISNILFYQLYWRKNKKAFFCGEFSWDSQHPPSSEQRALLPHIIAASKAMGCTLAALPWWWEELLQDSILLKKLDSLTNAMSLMRYPCPANHFTIEKYSTRVSKKKYKYTNKLYRLLERWRYITQPDKVFRAIHMLYCHITYRNNQKISSPIYASSDGKSILAYINTNLIDHKRTQVLSITPPLKEHIYNVYLYNIDNCSLKKITISKNDKYNHPIKLNEGVVLINLFPKTD